MQPHPRHCRTASANLPIDPTTPLAPLVPFLRERFALEWTGTHGAPHWSRVRLNGLLLAERTRASRRVVECFAVLHDLCRADEYRDPEHGARAAALVEEIFAERLLLSREEADLLAHACRHHSEGQIDADITIQVCWDADRLDLGRVGIRPQPRYLCTAAARDSKVIDAAWERSRVRPVR
jgi:uncharacterized protein